MAKEKTIVEPIKPINFIPDSFELRDYIEEQRALKTRSKNNFVNYVLNKAMKDHKVSQ